MKKILLTTIILFTTFSAHAGNGDIGSAEQKALNVYQRGIDAINAKNIEALEKANKDLSSIMDDSTPVEKSEIARMASELSGPLFYMKVMKAHQDAASKEVIVNTNELVQEWNRLASESGDLSPAATDGLLKSKIEIEAIQSIQKNK